MAKENIQSDVNDEGNDSQKTVEEPSDELGTVVDDLCSANSSSERAAAARRLGLIGDQRAWPHLVAAMFDEDQEVRKAAEVALGLISLAEQITVGDEQLSAKMARVLRDSELAHERIAKHLVEIEQLKAETRAMLTLLRAA